MAWQGGHGQAQAASAPDSHRYFVLGERAGYNPPRFQVTQGPT
jgi:hypothetical protein